MKEIFKIEDIFEIPDKGVVVSGINPHFDSLTMEEVRQQIGKEIGLKNSNGEIIRGSVLEINASVSIVGRKNFFLLLPLKLKNAIKSGSVVYNPNLS